MTTVEAKVLCGKCKVEVQGPDETQDDSVFSCPNCGRSDSYAAVMQEIGVYYRDHFAKQLNERMKHIERSRGFLTISAEGFDVPNREYRFVLSDMA